MEEEKTLDFNDLKKNATNVDDIEDTSSDDEDDNDAELVIKPQKKTPASEKEKPAIDPGLGAITEAPRANVGPDGVVIGAMANTERQDDANKALGEMDQQIVGMHKHLLEVENKLKENGTIEDKSAKQDESSSTGSGVVEVLIDKFGFGVPDFTEEEKKKLQMAEKIKLTEVTEVKLKTLKVKKKIDSGDIQIVKKAFNKGYTPIIAIASGYTCKMKSISLAEAMNLYQSTGNDTANTLNEKWSLIYDKLVDPSIGDFDDYEDFARKTAFSDYNTFLYGLICTSYPEKDTQTFTCVNEKCKREFKISYTNQELLRADLITDKQKDYIARMLDAASSVSTAKKFYADAVLSNPKRVLLPGSTGIVVEIFTPSVYDMINTYIKDIMNASNVPQTDDMRQMLSLVANVRRFFVPTNDGDDSYYEVEGTQNVLDTIKLLDEYDFRSLQDVMADYINPSGLNYGLTKVTCPHCHTTYGSTSVDMDEILFQRVRRRILQEIG